MDTGQWMNSIMLRSLRELCPMDANRITVNSLNLRQSVGEDGSGKLCLVVDSLSVWL